MIKKLFSLYLLTCCLLQPLEAKINMKALKGVTATFEPGCEHYSPALGMAATESGLIDNLRFFNVEFNETKGLERRYIEDKAPEGDAMAALILILFPSPAGQLNTQTLGDRSFGGAVSNPKTVALLLNYCYEIEKGGKVDNRQTEKTLLKTLEFKNKKSAKKTLQALLQGIQGALALEASETTCYPKNTTQQVLNAFFWQHFNTRQDIKTLLENLSMVDKAKLEDFDEKDKISEKDHEAIASKPNRDYDDIVAQIVHERASSALPYPCGSNPVSNGKCHCYDRKTDALDAKSPPFADCTEVMLRHLFSMCLYNKQTQDWDLSTLKALPKNAYLKKLIAFYDKPINPEDRSFTPDDIDNGSILTRSAWNRVVADLNAEENNGILYAKTNNELQSGFVNTINALSVILGLSQEPQPDFDENKPEATHAWVKTCFEKIFKAINDKYDYTVDVDKKLTAYNGDKRTLSGTFNIKVMHAKQVLFCFALMSSYDVHTEVILCLVASTHPAKNAFSMPLKPNTTEESFNLLVNKAEPSCALYRFLRKKITDNNEIIKLSERVFELISNPAYANAVKIPTFKILSNAINGLSWDDPHVMLRATSAIRGIITPLRVRMGAKFTTEALPSYAEIFKMVLPPVLHHLNQFDHTSEWIYHEGIYRNNLFIPAIQKCPESILWPVEELHLLENYKDAEAIKINLKGQTDDTIDLSSLREFPNLKQLMLCNKIDRKDRKDTPIHAVIGLDGLKIETLTLRNLKNVKLPYLENVHKLVLENSGKHEGLEALPVTDLTVRLSDIPSYRNLKTVEIYMPSEQKLATLLDSNKEIEAIKILNVMAFSKLTLSNANALKHIVFGKLVDDLEITLKNLPQLETVTLPSYIPESNLKLEGCNPNINRSDANEEDWRP